MPEHPAANEPRPWVQRLGAYLRIFGVGKQPEPAYLDALERMAKEAEAEHGDPSAAENGEWVAVTEMAADLVADPCDPPMIRKAADGRVEIKGQFIRRATVNEDA